MSRKNKLPMIYQAESTECSLACLAMICGYYGLDIDLLSLRENYSISLKGATLRDVVDLARYVHLDSRPVRCEMHNLKKLAKPAILHWDFEHFVVLREIKGGKYIIHDPALGIVAFTAEEVSLHFSGIAVEFTPTQDFIQARVGERLTLRGLFKITKGLRPFMFQIGLLTSMLEFFALLSPYFLKVAIDTGLANDDFDFITALAIGIAGVGILHGLVSFMRNYLVLYFGANFNLQLVSSLFRHMLRLPMSYYIKRMTGDLIDRYQSTNVIRRLFANELPQIILDGMVSVISLVVIFLISPILSLIAFAGFFAYLVLRLVMYNPLHILTEKMVKARSQENAHVIDTLRGMQPIKVFSKETERHHIWLNYYAKLVNADMNLGLMHSLLTSSRTVIQGLDLAASLYFGVLLVSSDQISLGLLFAFFVYKAHFTQRAATFAERFIEFRLIGVHLDRLSDIALSRPEQDNEPKKEVLPDAPFKIELRNVSFKYAPLEPYVLENVNFEFDTRDFVAIIGPSGGGKTTLFKLILGLLKPSEGQILYNGIPLDQWDMTQYRRLFGVVMQEDQLLSGSMVDNVAFFESSPDTGLVRECTQQALIFDEIDALPMKLNSRIGDLGSALSGGQKQRLLLARALYCKPKIMLMDEGTANLDEEVEHKLLDNLTDLGLTCISIAHRPETIRRANRIVHVKNGKIKEVENRYSLSSKQVSNCK